MDEEEAFLSRWSRRKLEAKRDVPAALPAAEPESNLPAAPDASATQAPAAGAQPGKGPEYREFFDPRVDEKLRRTALKKLFGDPHFNVMDGLDTYIDDYTKSDPIPDAMLRQLNQAQALFMFDDKEKEGAAAAGVRAGADDMAAAAAGSEASAQADVTVPVAAATDPDAAESAVAADAGQGTAR